MILRRTDEAIIQAKLGLELGPLDPLIWWLSGGVIVDAGDYSTAISYFKKALSINPNFGFAWGSLREAYLGAGDGENWFEMWKVSVCWDDEVITQVEKTLYEHGLVAAIEELLRLNEIFGKPGCQMGDYNKMIWYLQINDFEKAVDYMEQLSNASFSNLPYFMTVRYYDKLKVYPRYVEILRKMNLPVSEVE